MNDLERKTHKEMADSEGTFGSWQLCVCASEKEGENKHSYMPGAQDSHMIQRDGHHNPCKMHKYVHDAS